MLLDPGLPPSFSFALVNEMDTLFLTIISRPSEGEREGGRVEIPSGPILRSGTFRFLPLPLAPLDGAVSFNDLGIE